jgi:hypothetical protein
VSAAGDDETHVVPARRVFAVGGATVDVGDHLMPMALPIDGPERIRPHPAFGLLGVVEDGE